MIPVKALSKVLLRSKWYKENPVLSLGSWYFIFFGLKLKIINSVDAQERETGGGGGQSEMRRESEKGRERRKRRGEDKIR